MTRRTFWPSALLVLTLLLMSRLWQSVAREEAVTPLVRQPCRASDNAEQRLAVGCPIELWSATVPDLELLPQVSEGRARALTEAKEAILQRASRLEGDVRCEALTEADGIGRALAHTLCPYLQF